MNRAGKNRPIDNPPDVGQQTTSGGFLYAQKISGQKPAKALQEYKYENKCLKNVLENGKRM